MLYLNRQYICRYNPYAGLVIFWVKQRSPMKVLKDSTQVIGQVLAMP